MTFLNMFLIFGMSLFAQESENNLISKNGINILPEKGEFAIGIDAVPFLNLLNDKGDVPGFNFVSENTVFLKYFISDNKAIRAYFRIGNYREKEGDENFDNFDKDTETNITLGFGYEKRYGKSRVQGFYGFEGGLLYNKSKFVQNENVLLETSGFGVVVETLLGAEYFFAPKLSIGGQFMWGISFISKKDIENKTKEKIFILDTDNFGGSLILLFHF